MTTSVQHWANWLRTRAQMSQETKRAPYNFRFSTWFELSFSFSEPILGSICNKFVTTKQRECCLILLQSKSNVCVDWFKRMYWNQSWSRKRKKKHKFAFYRVNLSACLLFVVFCLECSTNKCVVRTFLFGSAPRFEDKKVSQSVKSQFNFVEVFFWGHILTRKNLEI